MQKVLFIYQKTLYNSYYVMYSNIRKEAFMDIQLKRGSLDVCVLASLLNEDSYGYKIIQSLDGVLEISESTLYPILRRLESALDHQSPTSEETR